MAFFSFVNAHVFGLFLPGFLFAAGIFYAFRLRFFPLFRAKTILRSLFRKEKGDGVSPFAALSLALAGTMGVGNVVGVATAITSGGPGAIFWMWVSALLSMLLKYAEVFLGVKYRRTDREKMHGGAFYYLRDGLGFRKGAILFALLFLLNGLTAGSAVQVQAAASSLENLCGVRPVFTGALLVLLLIPAVFGFGRKISTVTEKLIPPLCLLFAAFSLFVLCRHLPELPSLFGRIVREAFSLRPAAAGVTGYGLASSLRFGVTRGILSNEAGSGTSPTAHALAKTKSPVEQGFWGIFEVFADTVVLCSMTAFVILLSFDRLAETGIDGMDLAIASYAADLGPAAGVFLTVCVFLFAYATLISQTFYGSECLFFLNGNDRGEKPYKMLFLLSVLLFPLLPTETVWEISDFSFSLMTTINTFCLLLLQKEVVRETETAFRKSDHAENAGTRLRRRKAAKRRLFDD